MEKKIPVVAVVGPTASGKTGMAILLAKRLNGEIVSADSMQVYRRMDIATAKPTLEERQGIPHHLMDFLEPEETFSVADYVKRAHPLLSDIHKRGKLPILVGGTGLYISSVLDNIQFAENKSDPLVREELTLLAQEKGSVALWEELRKIDPELAAQLHPNNTGRIIRGIEAFRLTGIPMSVQMKKSRKQETPYQVKKIGLTFADRACLYERINRRVDQMMQQGLLEETRTILENPNRKTACQAIGYKELEGYLDGCCSLEEAVEHLKQETRRYAKRQLTWFRRDPQIEWYKLDEIGTAEAEKKIGDSVENFLKVCYTEK